MKKLLIGLFILTAVSGIAQEDLLHYTTIDWEENPQVEDVDTSYNDEGEVILKYNRIYQYIFEYEASVGDEVFKLYQTIHRKIRVNSDDAIQSHNKVYISMPSNSELVEAKARVITPNGKVVDLDESNILEEEETEETNAYKYFAIDGVVNGSDIEYTYTIVRMPYYEGTKTTVQEEYPSFDVTYKLVSPSNLGFAFKSYNGFPTPEIDSTFEDQNVYVAHSDFIDGMVDEDYMAYERNMQCVVHKLYENIGRKSKNFVSFGEISQWVHKKYYQDLTKKDTKAIKKLLSNSGALKKSTDEEKVRTFENYLKKNFAILEGISDISIPDMVQYNVAAERSMVILMANACKMMGIEHEVILTCNRYEDVFDEDFEHYAVLDHELMYFPSMNLYAAPGEQLLRLGIVPASWTNQKGLFIKEVEVGGMTTGLGEVKFIKPLAAEKTKDVMDIEVLFNDVAQPELKIRRELSGYSNFLQAIYNQFEEEQRKEVDEQYITFSDEKGELIKAEVSGYQEEDLGINPMVFEGEVMTSSIVESAGNKYLFNVGQLIGPQAEMYQEKKREFDIEHDHNMIYERTIHFTIPDGYDVSGLEKLNIDESYPSSDSKIMFKSSYVVNGNEVVITVVESYDQMFFDKSEIDDFRKIINAAANFNKIVLILVKK